MAIDHLQIHRNVALRRNFVREDHAAVPKRTPKSNHRHCASPEKKTYTYTDSRLVVFHDAHVVFAPNLGCSGGFLLV